MKPQSFGFRLLAAILAAFAVIGTATVGKPMVPFKGQSAGVVTTVGFDPDLGIVSTHSEGQGEDGRQITACEASTSISSGTIRTVACARCGIMIRT